MIHDFRFKRRAREVASSITSQNSSTPMLETPVRSKKGEKGQTIILLSVVLASFLMFFGFVINTGILVAAKISVQNAADAAAYAGAATQARQLNAISFLNYDMRRQYKKFLFRYVVIGNQANPKFPQFNPGAAKNAAHPDYYNFSKQDSSTGSSTFTPLFVPVVCVPMAMGRDDSCNHVNLPDNASRIAATFATGGLSVITQTLLNNMTALQQLMQSQCQRLSTINLFVLLTWLFRGNMDDSKIKDMLDASLPLGSPAFPPADKQQVETKVTEWVKGLGLFPRNIITGMRIENLASYINEIAHKEVTLDIVTGWEGGKQKDIYERSIQAFRSALVNLNTSVFNPSSLTMNELQNSAPKSQLDLIQVRADFNAYIQYMPQTAPSSNPNPSRAISCASSIAPFPVHGVPVGYKRNPAHDSFTHYAVRVTVKTNKLLFLPVKDGIELEALAAAKPFGSRIGPKDLDTDRTDPQKNQFTEKIEPGFVPDGSGNLVKILDCAQDTDLNCHVPTIKFDNNTSFYNQAFLSVIAAQAGNPDAPAYTPLTELGMAPNPTEVGHYNILPPWKNDSGMASEFIPYASSDDDKAANQNSPNFTHIYRVYAPIFPEGASNHTAVINNVIDSMFPGGHITGQNSLGIDIDALKNRVKTEMGDYAGKALEIGDKTENHETTTFAALELPMTGNPILNNHPYWVTKAEQVLSSWGPDSARKTDGTLGFAPRFGYSVKFVTLKSLQNQGMGTDDPDIDQVKH